MNTHKKAGKMRYVYSLVIALTVAGLFMLPLGALADGGANDVTGVGANVAASGANDALASGANEALASGTAAGEAAVTEAGSVSPAAGPSGTAVAEEDADESDDAPVDSPVKPANDDESAGDGDTATGDSGADAEATGDPSVIPGSDPESTTGTADDTAAAAKSKSGIGVMAIDGQAADETDLMDEIAAIAAGGSGTVEITASFTINSPIRYWDKNITLKSAAGGPYTITRGTFGTASDAVQGTYDPPMIEANATGTGTGSITLEDIIIDDAHTLSAVALSGSWGGQRAVIAAYDGRCSVILNNGAEIRNSAARQGAILLENEATLTMNAGSTISNWGGGSMTGYATAIYNFKGHATINTTIQNQTISNGVVVYNQGGDTVFGSGAHITGNTFSGGAIVIEKDTGAGDGGVRQATTDIYGEISGNTVAYLYRNDLDTSGTSTYAHLTIKNGGNVSGNFVTGIAVRYNGTFTIEEDGKLNNNQGTGRANSYTISSIVTETWTNPMDGLLSATNSNSVIDIYGQMNGNKTSGAPLIQLQPATRFTIYENGQVNNNDSYSLVGVINGYNAGNGSVLNIYGQFNGNRNLNWSSYTIGITIRYFYGKGVISLQNCEATVHPGAQMNNNFTGISGGVFTLTLGAKLTMLGGEMKGNKADQAGALAIGQGALTQDMDHIGGGAVQVSEGSSFTMKGGEISGNTAYYGGGVFVTGGTHTRFFFEGGTITGNTATAGKSNSSGSGQVWSQDVAIIANGDTPVLDDSNGHFIKIEPAAVLGSGYIGIQNNSNQVTIGTPTLGPSVVPTASGTGYKINQVVIVPATRTETLWVEQMDQFTPGNEGLTALRDAVTNTTTGYAATAGLSGVALSQLTYSGNIWFSTDKASGTQKISTNYPDELAAANYNKYEYVFSFQALDAAGVPVAGTQPTVIRPSRNGTTSLDVNVPIVAGAYGYGIVKYFYPKTTDLDLYITHEPVTGGAFIENTTYSDATIHLTYNSGDGHVYWTSADQSTPVDAGTAGNVNLSAAASNGFVIESIKLTAGDGTVRMVTPSALSANFTVSYYELAAETNGQRNVVHCKFAQPYYVKAYIWQKPDESWPTDSEPMPSDYVTHIIHAHWSSLLAPGSVLITEDDDPLFFTPQYRQGYHYDANNPNKVLGTFVYLLPGESGFPLTFKWYYALNSYKVVYDLDGGTIGGAATIPDKTGVHWTTDGLTPTGTAVKSGYTFGGWELRLIDYPVASDTAIAAGAQAVTSATSFGALMDTWAEKDASLRPNNEDGVEMKLVAVWNPVPPTVWTITYNLDGGTNAPGNPTTYSSVSTFPINIAQPTKTGYTFLGWTATGGYTLGSNTLSPSIPAGTTGNITLTAHWQVNTPPPPTTWKITYNLDGGTNAPSNPATYASNSTFPITIAVPSRAGYTFDGWTATGGLVIGTPSKSVSIPAGTTGDIVFTAHWTVIPPQTQTDKYYTVTFVDYDGTVLKVQKVKEGGDATAPKDPKRDGYTFTGWNKSYKNVQADITVKAKYKKNAAPPDDEDDDEDEEEDDDDSGGTTTKTRTVYVTQPTVDYTADDEPVEEEEEEEEETEPAVVEPPAVVDQPEPEEPDEPVIEDIDKGETPTTNGRDSWSLVDLILTIVGLILSVIMIVRLARSGRRKDRDGDYDSRQEATAVVIRKPFAIIVWIASVVAVVLFLITQDLTQPMEMVDIWTIVFAVLVVIQIVLNALAARRRSYEE